MFLLQVWRSSFHCRVLRLPWRMTISRRLGKVGLSPCLFTQNELRDDTKQDHVDFINAYHWQALPIVSSARVPHTGTRAHTDADVWTPCCCLTPPMNGQWEMEHPFITKRLPEFNASFWTKRLQKICSRVTGGTVDKASDITSVSTLVQTPAQSL